MPELTGILGQGVIETLRIRGLDNFAPGSARGGANHELESTMRCAQPQPATWAVGFVSSTSPTDPPSAVTSRPRPGLPRQLSLGHWATIGRMSPMRSRLADDVLPLVRSAGDLHRYRAANEHGSQMHEAVDILEEAMGVEDPAVVHDVCQRALMSSLRIIMRADDSAGIIGDACRRLIALHPVTAAAAQVPPAKLVAWMMKFQFDEDCDYFELNPVAYARALGAAGMARYREDLARRKAIFLSSPAADDQFGHECFVFEHNARRLAVLDRDVEAIIVTHARDQSISAWLMDAAEAFVEIEDIDRAIEWARRAALTPPDHQAIHAGLLWGKLLEEHRPEQLLAGRIELFERWPRQGTAALLHEAAGDRWPEVEGSVVERLMGRPWDAVAFLLRQVGDVDRAWAVAHEHPDLVGARLWGDLAAARGLTHPEQAIPVLVRLANDELVEAGAQHYRIAANLLARAQKFAAGAEQRAEFDETVRGIREVHRRRPRLQDEFDAAHLAR